MTNDPGSPPSPEEEATKKIEDTMRSLIRIKNKTASEESQRAGAASNQATATASESREPLGYHAGMPKNALENKAAAESTTPEDQPAPRQRKGVSVRRIPQQARSQQTVQAVLKAANDEIRRAGLDHLSTKRIAAAAGLSVGSLYGYFPNKESIVAALLESWLSRVFDAIDSVHPRHGGSLDIFSYLTNQMERARAVYEEQPGIGALFGMVMAIPALHEMVFKHGERVDQSMHTALKFYVPHANPEDVRSVARTIPLTCHHLMASAQMDPTVDQERMVADIRVCIVALATRLLASR